MKRFEITIWSDSKEIYSTSNILKNKVEFEVKEKIKKIDKKKSIKLYSFATFALALIDISVLLKENRFKVNDSSMQLLGFGGRTQFLIFIGLMFLVVAIDPILKIINQYKGESKKSILDKWGYTSKLKENSLVKDFFIIAGCILILFAPFLLF